MIPNEFYKHAYLFLRKELVVIGRKIRQHIQKVLCVISLVISNEYPVEIEQLRLDLEYLFVFFENRRGLDSRLDSLVLDELVLCAQLVLFIVLVCTFKLVSVSLVLLYFF